MAHKRKPKASNRQKDSQMLVTKESFNESFIEDDRLNLVSTMSYEAMRESIDIISNRYNSARQTTEAVAEKMANWEKQYNGEWQDQDDSGESKDNRIFLTKSREQVQIVSAYIQLLVSQLNPIVTMLPASFSSINASTDELRKAKVSEALLDFYFNDVWKIREDIFPKWLKNFLKFTMAVWKVTYREDDTLPDLKIEVVDRALLYIDPMAHDIKDARWVIEKYWLPKTEVLERIEEGSWILLDENSIENGISLMPTNILNRFYGKNVSSQFSVREDDQVEIWDYWQAPIKGIEDVYAVIIGGEGGKLARYGRNPFPYKGIPYRAKSYDPHEYQPDGIGLLEQYRPVQEVVNNFLNMRIKDVRENIISPIATAGNLITAQTQEDQRNGQKIWRLSEELLEMAKDPAFDIRKQFVELPIRTSTQELLTADLPFILGQGKETTSISDVFRGQNPQSGATLGQIQEQLSRNQGVFRPIYMNVMRAFEEIAEIAHKYFRSEDFFPIERIISIVGKNKYQDIIKGWHEVEGTNINIRSVNADDLDIDVSVNAVSGADYMASRTLTMSSVERIFQSIGQIPDLFQELKKQMDFSKVIELMLNSTGQDIDEIRFSTEDQQARAQAEQEASQQQMQLKQQEFQMQLGMQQQLEGMKAQIAIMKDQAIQATSTTEKIELEERKAQLDVEKKARISAIEQQDLIEQIKTKVIEQLAADLEIMRTEAELERKNIGISVGHESDVKEPK